MALASECAAWRELQSSRKATVSARPSLPTRMSANATKDEQENKPVLILVERAARLPWQREGVLDDSSSVTCGSQYMAAGRRGCDGSSARKTYGTRGGAGWTKTFSKNSR